MLTNGLGGFAVGTVADANTRRYQGLLVAALTPPLGRTVMVAKLDATMNYCGLDYSLSTNEVADGAIDPHGYRSMRIDNALSWIPVPADSSPHTGFVASRKNLVTGSVTVRWGSQSGTAHTSKARCGVV